MLRSTAVIDLLYNFLLILDEIPLRLYKKVHMIIGQTSQFVAYYYYHHKNVSNYSRLRFMQSRRRAQHFNSKHFYDGNNSMQQIETFVK